MSDTYYCFPDIHGEYDLLRLALDFVYRKHPGGGKIIFLGDYIDRGPKNKKVLETVMNPPQNWEFICLKGNHEDIFCGAYRHENDFYDLNVVFEFIPKDTLITNEKTHKLSDKYFPKEIYEWMNTLKLFHFEDNNVFAHAYYDDNKLPEDQTSTQCLWLRMDNFQSFYSKNNRLYLTHGHTPRVNGPITSPNRVNLDCGAVFHGRFVIGEYKNGIRGPVTFHQFEKI